MGASVDLVGSTEAETLVNYLKWLNGWSKKILRGMKMLYNSVETVRGMHHFNSNIDDCDKSFLVSKLDEMAVLLDGPATEMRHGFDLHHVGRADDGDLPIHISLEKAMDNIQRMCEGKQEVPVKDPLEYKPKTVPLATPATFSSYVKQICGLAKKIQELLNTLDIDGVTKPHFALSMTVVNQNGRPIKVEQFDVDQIVGEFNEKRLQEKLAQITPEDITGGKGGNGQVQLTT